MQNPVVAPHIVNQHNRWRQWRHPERREGPSASHFTWCKVNHRAIHFATTADFWTGFNRRF